MAMKINILPKAQDMLNSRLESDQFLRVGVTEGGCAGMKYSAEIDRDLQGDDEVVFQLGDIRIVSNVGSRGYLDGLTIDFSNDLIGGGLQFTNAKTEHTCGCGSSFSLSGFPIINGGKCGK